jgi:hypothetical protein
MGVGLIINRQHAELRNTRTCPTDRVEQGGHAPTDRTNEEVP